MDKVMLWISHTPLHEFMINTIPAFPACETLHFIGLCLLFGSIGLLDLRGLGLFKEMPLEALHKLVPLGLLGFCINLVTGILFIATDPKGYIGNPAFTLKMSLLPIAALNAIIFELLVFRPLRAGDTSVADGALIKVSSGLSLLIWITVLICGRWIPYA